MLRLRIGIIGGGPSGATACKACLEEGFEVVVYERTAYTGGLWRYHDEDVEGVPSVAKSTIINSSKEMSAFSDFPPPPHFPNFMHNSKMIKYIDMYGAMFGYERYVRFRHDVIKVEPNTDYDSTGKWIITVKDLQSDQIIEDVVDGVMVCTGHHVQPSVPTFKDQDKFTGEILHTHSYKKPDRFSDKKVVVVGIGNSGCDASVDLSSVADKVYLSTRRGSWIFNKVGPYGSPLDSTLMRRSLNLLQSLLPYSLVCFPFELYFNLRFNHNKYQLKPEHRVFSQHGTMNDHLPSRILSGTVVVKQNIERFTPNGVIFQGETTETPCDAVVLATGYKVSFPFLSRALIPISKNQVQLYKYMFAPNLKHPKTLAFITLVQPLGALLPIGEMQSRWFAQLMANKLTLPNSDKMVRDIDNKKKFQKRFYKSERHTIQVDWINFMDELALELGAKPDLLKYFFTDPQLWRALFFGPSVPYQYRLEGPHSWSGARETILSTNDRIAQPLKTRYSEIKAKKEEKGLNLIPGIIGIILFISMAFLLIYLI